MTITAEGDADAGILALQTIFPPEAIIRQLNVTINKRRYRVYFNFDRHEENSEESTYVFLRMIKGPKFINLCSEDEMAYLMEAFVRYA